MCRNKVEKKGSELEESSNSDKLYIESERKTYNEKYPDEIEDFAEVVIVDDMRISALDTYNEFKYPDDYIKGIDNYASWPIKAGLTIHNKTMGDAPRILISRKLKQINTFMHENTHINDYYTYCSKYNYLNLNYMEFLKLSEFQAVFLLSEYRAFYRDNIYAGEMLIKEGKSINFQHKARFLQLYNNLRDAVNAQDLEKFQYKTMQFIGQYSAFSNLYPEKKKEIEELLTAYSKNMINLYKFLYPIKNLPFIDLKSYFGEFNSYIDAFIDRG